GILADLDRVGRALLHTVHGAQRELDLLLDHEHYRVVCYPSVGAHQKERVGRPGDVDTQVGLGAVGLPPLRQRLAAGTVDIEGVEPIKDEEPGGVDDNVDRALGAVDGHDAPGPYLGDTVRDHLS